MKKIYYLSTCSTCIRIIKELGINKSFETQDIKTNKLTSEQIDEMKEIISIKKQDLRLNEHYFESMDDIRDRLLMRLQEKEDGIDDD